MNPNINLRVFKRSEDNVILFWNTDGLNDDQRNNVRFELLERDSEDGSSVKLVRDLKVTLASSDQFNTSKDVAIGIIEHVTNDIEKDDSVLIKMVAGTQTKLDAFLRISPSGVLPMLERDNKRCHVQNFGWDQKKKRWAKLPLVKTEDGSYAIPVVCISCKDCKK